MHFESIGKFLSITALVLSPGLVDLVVVLPRFHRCPHQAAVAVSRKWSKADSSPSWFQMAVVVASKHVWVLLLCLTEKSHINVTVKESCKHGLYCLIWKCWNMWLCLTWVPSQAYQTVLVRTWYPGLPLPYNMTAHCKELRSRNIRRRWGIVEGVSLFRHHWSGGCIFSCLGK